MARLPISEFLQEVFQEFDPDFEVREGTAFYDMFFKPVQYIVQPLRDEADDVQESQSFLRILQNEDPDSFDEEAVDALSENLFVPRIEGSTSSGVARVYYADPVDREWAEGGFTAVGSNGENYSNPAPFAITASEMSLNFERNSYYYDIPVQSDNSGVDTELDVDELVSVLGDPDVTQVGNPNPITGGLKRETNTELIERTKESIAVRDLVTGKGTNAILFENFAGFLKEVNAVGFGDPEMMRDIVYNVHIGGRVDVYVKTANIAAKTQDFIGLLIDGTRQTKLTKNIQLYGTTALFLGVTDLTREGGNEFIVRQVKTKTAATALSSVDMSSPIDLSVNSYITLSIDGTEKTIRVAGVTPAQTTRNEIVAIINNSFGFDVAEPVGNTLRVSSLSPGLSSTVVVKDPPAPYNSAILEVFGLATGSVHEFFGTGPLVFIEGQNYEFDDLNGRISRILGTQTVDSTAGESTASSAEFTDATPNIFDSVVANDILTIASGDDAGDYRIIDVDTGTNTLTLDADLTLSDTGIEYIIRSGGIKDGELLYVEVWYKPLSIDIGKYILLDADTGERGIRPGREDRTITDVAFLRASQIEIIDPVTLEGLGEFLDASAGFGQGGFGVGPFGVGSKAQYRMIVNEPHHRFSAWEDSYIAISQELQGLSFRVYYETVVEIESMHDFCRSENERVLDSDILVKHFLPAYVSGTISYKVDETDKNIPDNETLQQEVIDFISAKKYNTTLQISDVIQYITRRTDPYDKFGTYVEPFTLKAVIMNTNGSNTIITSDKELVIPEEDPFPKETDRPLSPRIAHWIGDNIVLVRT